MRLIILLMLLSFISSCGKNIDDSNSELSLKSKVQYDQYVMSSDLSKDVPKGLGQILVRKESFDSEVIKTCTWVLVDNDIALTNSHCIPAQILTKDCSQYIGGSFMGESGVERRVCKRILNASKLTQRSQKSSDIAIIELDRAVNTKFILDRSGILKDELLTIHAVKTVKSEDTLEGTYEKKYCLAKKSHSYGHFENAISKTIPVFDLTHDSCNITERDLGAAVTDSKGQLKAIMLSPEQKRIEFSSNIYNVTPIKNVALIRNLSCSELYDTRLDAGRSNDCDQLLADNKGFREERLSAIKDQVSNLIRSKFNLFISKLPKSFDYTITVENIQDSKDVGINIIPKCMNPIDSWPDSERSKTKSTGMLPWLSKTSYQTQIPIYRAEIAVNFNEFGEIDFNAEIYEFAKNSLSIDEIDPISVTNAVEVKAWPSICSRFLKPYSKKIKLCK